MRQIRKYESTIWKGDPVQIGKGVYERRFEAFLANFERAKKENGGKAMTTSQLLMIFATKLGVKMSRQQAQKYLNEAFLRGRIRDTTAYYEVE